MAEPRWDFETLAAKISLGGKSEKGGKKPTQKGKFGGLFWASVVRLQHSPQ